MTPTADLECSPYLLLPRRGEAEARGEILRARAHAARLRSRADAAAARGLGLAERTRHLHPDEAAP